MGGTRRQHGDSKENQEKTNKKWDHLWKQISRYDEENNNAVLAVKLSLSLFRMLSGLRFGLRDENSQFIWQYIFFHT
jgi:hypothetical protein